MNKKGNYNLHSDTQRHIIFQGFQFKSITTLERPVSGISSIQHRLIQKISFTTLQLDITEKIFTQEAENSKSITLFLSSNNIPPLNNQSYSIKFNNLITKQVKVLQILKSSSI
jgi:hypothetical protein